MLPTVGSAATADVAPDSPSPPDIISRIVVRSTKLKCTAAPSSSVRLARSDTDLLVVEHMRLLGRLAHLFDCDRIEIAEKGFARPGHGGLDDPLKEHRV